MTGPFGHTGKVLEVAEVLVVVADSTVEVTVLEVSTIVVELCFWTQIQLKWNIFHQPKCEQKTAGCSRKEKKGGEKSLCYVIDIWFSSR